MNPHLFLDAEMVEDAWLLRAMLAEVKKIKRFQTSCQLKTQIAERTELPDVASRWRRIGDAMPVKEADGEVAAYAAEHFPQEMALLQTIPGVGITLAPWIIATLHPIHRFDTYPKAKRYIGMNPRQQDTGKKVGKQKISRTGSAALRGLLYIAAMSELRHDNRFHDLYNRKVAAGMPGKKAIIATAESIFSVAYHILKSEQPYHDPARPAAAAPEARPAHLIPQAEAARILGISRQAVGQQVKAGTLRAEKWNGRQHVVAKYLEIALAAKAGEGEEA